MRKRTRRRPSFLLLSSAFLLLFPLGARAFDVRVDSETILRWFERDTGGGKEQNVQPAYEYLRLDLGELEGKGFSAHAYGWGRHDFADNGFFDDESQGEFLYGYLQYTHDANNFGAWLGRQYIFEGVSNESVDGGGARGDVTRFFAVSAYAGQPVALEERDGRDGDFTWGGRLSHHLGAHYDVGLSYKLVNNDGDKEEEVLGIDSSVNLPFPLTLHGFSARNLVDDEWQEHSYEARWSIYAFLFRPYFEYFDYDAFFDTGENSATPFLFLVDSDEEVTSFGGDLSWHPTSKVELELKAKHYDYDERDDNAWYYAFLVVLHAEKGLSQVGGEVGVMDGDTSDTRYTLWRGYFYWDAAPAFLSGDVVYAKYDDDLDAEPLDDDDSLFLSLGAGQRYLKDTLEVRFSGDYSSDPYFDDDFRGMLAVRYLFDR